MRIYTDGSCTKAGKGGWGWCVAPEGLIRGSGAAEETTNQRMEMKAALEALVSFPEIDITIVSDSRYVVDCFNKHWRERWLRNGWKTANGGEVANKDLWEQLFEAVKNREITFEWVKGHSIDPMNSLADKLAHYGRTGTEPREEIGTFEFACTAMLGWWKAHDAGEPPTPEVVEAVRSFLYKLKLMDDAQ